MDGAEMLLGRGFGLAGAGVVAAPFLLPLLVPFPLTLAGGLCEVRDNVAGRDGVDFMEACEAGRVN